MSDKILIDIVTGTVLNYDNNVYVVDVENLSEEAEELLNEWYQGGNDNDAIELALLAGTPVHDALPRQEKVI